MLEVLFELNIRAGYEKGELNNSVILAFLSFTGQKMVEWIWLRYLLSNAGRLHLLKRSHNDMMHKNIWQA